MTHAPPLLLLADLFEVIGSLVGLFFLVLWVVRQIVEAQKQPPVAGRGGRPAGAPPEVAGRAMPAGGQQADPLRDQVEEFLRRAGRVPPGKPAAPAGRESRPMAGSGIEVLVNDEGPPAEAVAAEAAPATGPRRTEMPPVAPPMETSKPKPRRAPRQPILASRRETVAERAAARQAARARRLSEQTSQLGQRIVKEDQEFDVQLAAKFDHKVGTLTSEEKSTAEAPPVPTEPPAAQIAAMLTNPEGVRQAIILHEILRRPVDRW
jgi:hypothetical protein